MSVPSRGRPRAKPHPFPATLSNYFTGAEIAARYTKVRPFFQDEVVERLRKFAGVERFQRALDVGCGTGQSSIALAAVADHVTAVDASEDMLKHALLRPNVVYQLGFAEQLNFRAGEFDLVSAGSALHWFDQDRFFARCQKILAPAGVLAVYNDHFTTHMESVAACKHWMRTHFAKRFPVRRRGMRDIDELKAAECGFTVAHRSSFSHLVPFSREGFIAYLMTRSNTLATIESGEETQQSIADWLGHELAPIVPDGVTGSFIFKCNLWLLRKATDL
jgi:SAM-dependent methyltransferase